jgi:DNA polymerase-3 subunit chi
MKVEFHSGVADRVSHACRLLRKAHAAGARVAVCGAASWLDALDSQLWTFEALSFVPHVRRRRGEAHRDLLERTPVWLTDDPAQAPGATVLLNLGPDMAPGWERFDRILEIVEDDPSDSEAARRRWRQYATHEGAVMIHHSPGTRIT